MSVGRRFLAVVVASWLFAGAAWAADDNKVIYPGSSPRSETAAPAAGGMNSLTLVLGLVLAGVGGWFVWRNRHRVAPGRDAHALTVEETRALAPYQNATALQVTSAVIGGMVWALEHPNEGIVEADEMDFHRLLEIQLPYLGPVKGFYTDWTPLTGRPGLFPEDIDTSDPWQFRNVLVG